MFRSFFLVFLLLVCGCRHEKKTVPQTTLTHDEIVKAIVELYTVNAALDINDAAFRDSTASVYFTQVSKILGRPAEVIREDFRILSAYPDTLMALQSKALDTLRELQFHLPAKPAIHIGIN